MTRRVYVVALVLSVACSGESDNKQPITAAKPAALGALTPTANSTAANATPNADVGIEPLCASPCQLLTKYSLKELQGTGYCGVCGSSDDNACGGENPFSESACDQHDFLRNCIYASHGYAFKKATWRERFGAFDWYEPRDEFSEKEFSSKESRNIAALRQRAGICAAKRNDSKVAPADRDRVRAFTKKLANGKASLETLSLFDENGAVWSRELDGFKASLMDQVADGYFELEGAATQFRYAQGTWAGGAIPKGHRVIELAAGQEPDEHDWFVRLLVSNTGKNKAAYIFAL